MSGPNPLRHSVLMVAYTDYQTDPRVIREAEAAASAGFRVDFLALRRNGDPPQQSIRGVHVFHLDQSRYRGTSVIAYLFSYIEFFLRCTIKIVALQIRERYSVVHVNNMPDFLVFCAVLPKLMGAKVVLDIHDPMANTFASKFNGGGGSWCFKLLLWQERLSAAFADRVITVHEPLKHHVLVKQHGLAAEAIDVIANFADNDLFVPRCPARNDDRLRFVFHGTILERYGLRNAMHSLAGMQRRDRISVTLIGEGDFSATLKALLASLGLNRTVRFDNRKYPVHDMPSLLAEFDVGLVPLEISSITNYALPLKLLEYVALGMPSVTVRNVAIGHYFGDGDCFWYDPTDVESLRCLLDHLADAPNVVREYHRRALVLRERFLWTAEREKYVALLRKFADGPIAAGRTSARSIR